MDTCLLGVDIGSGGCKVTLLNLEKETESTLAGEYFTDHPRPGWAEQDPEDWVNRAGELIRKILQTTATEPRDIRAVAVGGVTHSPVLLGDNLRPIIPALHITDTRSADQARGLEEHFGNHFLNIGLNRVGPMWTAAMLLWIREEWPDVWGRIKRLLFPKDYVRFRLSGSHCTDWVDAEGTLFFDSREKCWDEEVCSYVGIPQDWLPAIAAPWEIVGAVNEEGASWSGLVAGTPVVTGTTDTLLEVVAAGAREKGDCTVKLATFGRICVLSDKAVADPGLITYSYLLPGLWYPGTGTKACASSLKWFRDNFCRDIMEKENVFSLMEDEACFVPAGSEGLLYHPYLQGEGSPYYDADLRASFLGMTSFHERGHLIRAIMEGTAFSLLDSLMFLKERGLSPSPPLRLIGGGSKSHLWSKIVADILETECVVPSLTDSSLGGAMLAGVGVGLFGTLTEAQERFFREDRRIIPDPQRSKIYRALFSEYRKVHDLLEEVNHRLSAVQKDQY